jgi:hypothetical protein
MVSLRWAPWLMMLVADVFPGGCCGGSRYTPPGPPGPPTGMNIVNHTSLEICSVSSAPDRGTPPTSYGSLKEMHLPPGGTQLVAFPSDHKFVLRVLSCKNEELLVKPGMEPLRDGIVTVEVK